MEQNFSALFYVALYIITDIALFLALFSIVLFIIKGGIVVGLTLPALKFSEFHKFSVYLINIILGPTGHEILGPIASRFAIGKAGELYGKRN